MIITWPKVLVFMLGVMTVQAMMSRPVHQVSISRDVLEKSCYRVTIGKE